MLPTPFDSNGEVDTASFARLLECARNAKCTGVVTLGVMGEAHRLTDSERNPIIDAIVAAAGSDLTVTRRRERRKRASTRIPRARRPIGRCDSGNGRPPPKWPNQTPLRPTPTMRRRMK